MITAKPTRPVLRYHGGKFNLGPWIISRFPEHRVYVEPYGGAASVLLQKSRAYAEVYNDLDGEIVNLFRVLRDPAQARELKRQVELTPFARAEFELSYTADGDPIEQARRTLFRSIAGFGSGAASGHQTGFRSNVTRSHTTPAIDWANYPGLIEGFSSRLRGVIIESRPAPKVMRQYDTPETLHYLDPPYPLGTRTLKGHYAGVYRFEMSDGEHREMAGTARELKGKVVISGYACDLYDRELFADWHREEKATHADGARDRVEVLWMNEAAWKAQTRQPSMFARQGDNDFTTETALSA